MTKMMPITEARYELPHLLEQFEHGHETTAVAVTRRGKPVLAVMPWDFYEAIIETLEVMGDADLAKSLKQSIREIKAGKLYTSEQVRKELGL